MKKLLLAIVILLAAGLITTALGQTKVQSGTWGADVNSVDYTLAGNDGDRSITVSVEFFDPFDTKPDVLVAVSHLDADKETNMRYSISVLSVSRDAMTVKIRTWGDTQIYGIGGYWMAHVD